MEVKMEILAMVQKFLGFMSGKKTNIGAILIVLAQFAQMNGANEWHVVIQQIIEMMNISGLGIASIGLADKGRKSLLRK
jgi:hypothetical protein